MSDLHHVLPDRFPAHRFAHLLPSLDRHRVTTSDILTLDAVDAAKRAQVPVAELRKLQQAIVSALHADLGVQSSLKSGGPDAAKDAPDAWHATEWRTISTLDDHLDAELGGGVPAGYLTEITGESGAGKTQFLLTLLLSTQLPAPRGLAKSALYISTEAPLATTRLTQLLDQHPRLSTLPAASKPSLSRILSIQTPDLESQDHILRYQLPVAIQRHNVGLVVLDSVAANYRAEFERTAEKEGSGGGRRAAGEAMAQRTAQLVQLGALLRTVARAHGVAVVVANQVSDRFSPTPVPPSTTATTSRNPSYASNNNNNNNNNGQAATTRLPTPTPPTPSAPALALSPDPLTLDHQQRWFTGWGDNNTRTTTLSAAAASESSQENLKTPALGLVWANQIAARVALLKAPVYNTPPNPWVGLAAVAADGRSDWRGEEGEDGGGGVDIERWRRWMKVVFAPWAAPSSAGPGAKKGVEYVILGGGVASTAAVAEEKERARTRTREAEAAGAEMGGKGEACENRVKEGETPGRGGGGCGGDDSPPPAAGERARDESDGPLEEEGRKRVDE